jgi:hypothetical protein
MQVQSSLHAALIYILDESKKFSNVLMAATMTTFYGLYRSRLEALRNFTADTTEYTRVVPLELMQHISSVSGPGSSVGIATGYGLDVPGIESRWG